MSIIAESVAELVRIFRSSASKHEAHARCAPVLERMSRSPETIPESLAHYLKSPASLNRGNYPVVAMELALNATFSPVANCWVPLPDGNVDLSTKAIHHHGKSLLTTVTIFGPGYEHWTFTTPEPVDADRGLYRMGLIEAARHALHHVAFVGPRIAHTPFYPPSLSITLALFSSDRQTTWRDRLKALPGVKNRKQQLVRLARRLGLAKALDIKTVDSFDFHPVPEGFQVVREREEFALGPAVDHVTNVFHILQQTGSERVAAIIEQHLASGRYGEGRAAAEDLLPRLRRGEPIAGRLSPGHIGQPRANFTRADILRSLQAGRGA